MNNRWLTAILGAGFLGTVYALRRYIGIVLVLLVTTCSFRAPIVDYINKTQDQGHQERMAVLKAQQDQAKLNAEQQLKLVTAQQEAEAQARQDLIRADEQVRKDQARIVLQQRQRAQAEINRVAPLRAELYQQYWLNRQASNWIVANPQWAQIEQYDKYLAQQYAIVNQP